MDIRTPHSQMNKNQTKRDDNDRAILWTIVAFVLLSIVVYIVYAAYDGDTQYMPAERAIITNPNTPPANNNAATAPAPGNTTAQ